MVDCWYWVPILLIWRSDWRDCGLHGLSERTKDSGRSARGEYSRVGLPPPGYPVEVSALGTALELALSGTSPANIAIPAMAGIHALIGIGEGLITVWCVGFSKCQPERLA